MLTARGSEDDRIQGLDLGADDYLVKPFSPRELVSRVRAILRRVNPRSGRGTWLFECRPHAAAKLPNERTAFLWSHH